MMADIFLGVVLTVLMFILASQADSLLKVPKEASFLSTTLELDIWRGNLDAFCAFLCDLGDKLVFMEL